jgi:hypothetical protein
MARQDAMVWDSSRKWFASTLPVRNIFFKGFAKGNKDGALVAWIWYFYIGYTPMAYLNNDSE